MSVTATVTIPYAEFEAIQKERQRAEERAAAAEQKLIDVKVEQCDQVLLALSLASLEIVRYAVSSMPPESNRGWPYEELKKISASLPKAPFAVDDHVTLAATLGTFATECERHELRRRATEGTSVLTRPAQPELVAHPDPDQ